MSVVTASPPTTALNYVVLAGNPNCGKTTLFNALTGLRAKVGNYPGVTVERKEGRLTGTAKSTSIRILDLPGTYSLSPQSLDEQVARDILFHRLPEVPPPAVVVVIVDASNLQRNLYFATQIIELGYPTILALNMIDVAQQNGVEIDSLHLSAELGIPVYPLVASEEKGLAELRAGIVALLEKSGTIVPRQFAPVNPLFGQEVTKLASLLIDTFPETRFQAAAEALLVLGDERFFGLGAGHYPAAIGDAVTAARKRLETAGIDWRSVSIEARYGRIAEIERKVSSERLVEGESWSDRIDGIVTHRFWGFVIFLLIMTLMFQSIFSFAEQPMDWMKAGVDWLGNLVSRVLPEGALHSLIVDGVIAGVGAVVVFLPQICLLFLFIGLLEDTGYMARAAFLMDRLMSRVGLHGKSFIPMLSSFACAIPGIMAARTIESPKDRLATILVAPLMSCSARLPVYTVLIAACIPKRTFFGIFGLQALTLLSMYLLGIVAALATAWLFKRTLLKGPTPMLIMELPPYKRPLVRTVLRHMWDRSRLFLRRAGTVILGIMILLWFLATYPRDRAAQANYAAAQRTAQAAAENAPTPESKAQAQARLVELQKEEAGHNLRFSYAGRLGRTLEPIIRPLGYDWKIGIGIVGSFAAREVFVSTMSLVYNVGELDESADGTSSLADTLKDQVREDGTAVYTPLVGISLMVFYVFALQCVSTVAIVRRETNSWKWPAFQWFYMGFLAWTMAFLVYQGGRLLGLG